MLIIGADTFLTSLTALSLADLPKGSQECFLCFEPYQAPQNSGHPIRLPCNHIICKDCLAKWVKSSTTNANNNSCPFCRAELFERDDDDAPFEDERDDDLLPGPLLPAALRPGVHDRRAPSPAADQGQRSAEYQRLVEQFEQFNREIRAPDQPLGESHAQEPPLRENAAAREARDDAERLRWYIPRHQPELARLHQERARARLEHANARLERARARVALRRDLAPRRRPPTQELPRLARSDADYEALAAMTEGHIKEAENLMRNDELYNREPRVNQTNRARRYPAESTRVHVEEARNNEDYETESRSFRANPATNTMVHIGDVRNTEDYETDTRRFGQDTAASINFAAKMSARAEEVPEAIETPMEYDRRMAALRQGSAEEGFRIDEVVNGYIRHEENDVPLRRLRRQSATLGTGLGRADVRRRPRLGEELHQIPPTHEPSMPLRRHDRRMTAMRENRARAGALVSGLVNQSSGGRRSDASPRWPSREMPTLGAGIGGADVTGRPLLP